METEIAAVLTIRPKLTYLQKLLDRRIDRASVDIVSPTLPLLEKVYKLGEYKRLAANLAVMEHRIRCGLGDERTDAMIKAANRGSESEEKSFKAARQILEHLGVTPSRLREYFALPLYRAEFGRLRRIADKRNASPYLDARLSCGAGESVGTGESVGV